MMKVWIVFDRKSNEFGHHVGGVDGVFCGYDQAVEFVRTEWPKIAEEDIDDYISEHDISLDLF